MSIRGGRQENRNQAEADETIDTILELLADPRRRFVIASLRNRERVTLTELADVVTGWETTFGGGVASPDERNRVRSMLHHAILPKLEDAGIVSYDRCQGDVRLITIPALMADILDVVATYSMNEPTGRRIRRRVRTGRRPIAPARRRRR